MPSVTPIPSRSFGDASTIGAPFGHPIMILFGMMLALPKPPHSISVMCTAVTVTSGMASAPAGLASARPKPQ